MHRDRALANVQIARDLQSLCSVHSIIVDFVSSPRGTELTSPLRGKRQVTLLLC